MGESGPFGMENDAKPHRMARLLYAGVAAVALVVPGCRVRLDEESLRTALSGHVEPSCIFHPPAFVAAQSGAFSLAFESGAYWIFGETFLADEREEVAALRNSTGATANQVSADCSGDLSFVAGEDGLPLQIVPLTEDEEAFNADPANEERVAIWPLSGFVREGVGHLYYRKVRLRSYFDLTPVGTGVARLEWGSTAERDRPDIHADEPTLIWVSPQTDWGSGAVIGEDGWAYVYGCSKRAPLESACKVARGSAPDASNPSAYSYFDGTNWSDSVENAADVVQGPTHVSLAWNGYLGRYLAIYAPVLGNDIVGRPADTPFGPFGDEVVLLHGDPSKDFGIGDVHQHPFFQKAGGRSVLISYFTDPEEGEKGMRIVEYQFP